MWCEVKRGDLNPAKKYTSPSSNFRANSSVRAHCMWNVSRLQDGDRGDTSGSKLKDVSKQMNDGDGEGGRC
jgi:hypothetical protein